MNRWKKILNDNLDKQTVFLRSGNDVKYLINGEDIFKAMVDAIRTATKKGHYIYLLGWILVDDFPMITGQADTTFKNLITEASNKNVQVRAMLWDSAGTINTFQVVYINFLKNGGAILDNATLNFGCHHQKVLIVKGDEGLITFCGGADINSDRTGAVDLAGSPLRDVHCQIKGPSAYDLLTTFIKRWEHNNYSKLVDSLKEPLLGKIQKIPAPYDNPNTCSVCIARTFNPVSNLDVFKKERDIKKLLIAAIRNAKNNIYIEEQYLFEQVAADELRKIIPRIKNLTILIAGQVDTMFPCSATFRKQFISTLTQGLSFLDKRKINIFMLVTPNSNFFTQFGPGTYVHSKCVIIDDELAVIGGANINSRGWDYDSEVAAFIFNDKPVKETFAKQLRKRLWANHLNSVPEFFNNPVTSSKIWLESARNNNSKVRLYKTDLAPFDIACLKGVDKYIIDPPSG